MSVKISVVMASYLNEYDFSATERVVKFHRAVTSFLNQNYANKELIIVADGCYSTAEETVKNYFPQYSNIIKLVQLEKQPMFSGNVRNVGCFHATGDIICYLDTDDMLGSNHLTVLAHYFQTNPSIIWVYYDDYIIYRFHPITREILNKEKRDVSLDYGSIGTSSIAHRKLPSINWVDCDGYGHDWDFIKNKLIDSGLPHIKIDGAEYDVCHIPNSVDS